MKRITLLIALLIASISPVAAQTGPLSGMCVVMVHGILGFDDTTGLANGLVKYWGGLDGYLRSQGAKVATPGTSAANDLPTRAGQLKTYLNTWMPANGCTKIYIIAHSQGGLVSRYLASNLSYSSKITAISTVNSHHRGAPMADITLGIIPSWLKPFANSALSLLASLIYRDGRPQDVVAMGKTLTVSFANAFNSTTPNLSTIKYFSHGTSMAWADLIQHPIMALTHPITWAGGLFYGLGTSNDGVVPYSSQQWGTWKGSPSSRWFATGIDHLQATNLEWSGQTYFDVSGWYLGIAKTARGY